MFHHQNFEGDDNGNVTGVKTTLVHWSKDDAGRWTMKDVEGMNLIFFYLFKKKIR